VQVHEQQGAMTFSTYGKAVAADPTTLSVRDIDAKSSTFTPLTTLPILRTDDYCKHVLQGSSRTQDGLQQALDILAISARKWPRSRRRPGN
jgi:hypothetical protein